MRWYNFNRSHLCRNGRNKELKRREGEENVQFDYTKTGDTNDMSYFYAAIKFWTILFQTVIDTFSRLCTVTNYIPYSRYKYIYIYTNYVASKLPAVNEYLNAITANWRR